LNILSEKSKKKRKSIDNNGGFVESTPTIARNNSNNNVMSNLSTNSTKSSNSSNSSINQINSFNELTNAVTNFSRNFTGLSNNSNNNNNHDSNNNNIGADSLVEENIENDLIKHIQNIESNIVQSKIDDLDKDSIISNIQVYLNIYCTRGEKFNPKFNPKSIKEQFKELGLRLLSIHSLYIIFERARKELLIK
jgi:hypothetical protein